MSAAGRDFDLILRDAVCVTPAGRVEASIGVRAGKIAAIGDPASWRAAETLALRGLHVLPGLIDTQVHFREPGLEHKEDLAAGTAGAAAGGIVAVFEMPNTKPSTLTAGDLAEKLERAKGRAWTDHAFYVGAAAENADALGTLERLPGTPGVKIFMGSSTGSLLVADDATLMRVLAHGSRRVAVHAEDEMRLEARKPIAAAAGHARAHPEWRDVETALTATRRLLAAARATRRRVHVLHVTTEEEMAFLAGHKDIASVEVLPQHLILSAPGCYERLGSLAQMNPPIRDERHRAALWRAVNDFTVDVMGSDHAPHTREEKAKPYPASPSGLPGVQTMVPLMLDCVSRGLLPLERVVDLLAHGPQRVFGIVGKGRLAVGYDADFTVVDLGARREIRNAWIHSRCGYTPFDGMTVTGWPVMTIIRGRTVMREDELIGPPAGEPLRFFETL
ncbi:MAG: dihydroorotase [Alphaproteobacteria bacterium]|nr:dihydroorotase [Alphaproteobacteria bacterium]